MSSRHAYPLLAGLPLVAGAALFFSTHAPAPPAAAPRFLVSFPSARSAQPLDGRLLLMLSSQPEGEPRFQISYGPETQLVFGVDVDGLRPGTDALVDAGAFGYPIQSLADVPAGTYRVQALLNRYETFHRGDGHVVQLPPDRGEGQQWNRKPGNLYSTPMEITFDPAGGGTVRIVMDQEIPPIADAPETRYIKHERIQSTLLTDFWGRPTFLGAHVLLPEGFDEHPNARYPLVIDHGHFPHTFSPFREEPPDMTQPCVYSARFRLDCYNRIQDSLAYQFYRDWTGPDFPRVLLVQIQHPTPYFDDSYAVNSENNGPYGDAIMHELIPYLEQKYRGIGEGWARFTYGGSTGGWEAMAVQVFYPDDFNGAWVACPDPIDFRAYGTVNIYDDDDAYYLDSDFKRTPRPVMRDWRGHVGATVGESSHMELALGTHSRSGQQWDIWQAVYSPVGADGYPVPIWDKLTGTIDHDVAEYWREHYDLSYILKRDWATLGPKLEGKLFIYVGDMDTYYLNDAVYLTEEFLESTTNPYYAGEVDYGDRAEHCWNGDHTQPNAVSRMRYAQMFIPRIPAQVRKNAPAGADTVSWRY